MSDTWQKKVKVGGKKVPKKQVLEYYEKLWKKNKKFRDTLKKKGIFVRSSYGNQTAIRRKGIKINNIKDLRKAVKNHAVEFISPLKNLKHKSYIDIDMPKKYRSGKKKFTKSLIKKLKKRGVSVSEVSDAPRGAHVFSKSSQKKLKKALQEIAKEDQRLHVGKRSKKKIVLDPDEPNVAIPRSLSTKGKPYKKWKKTT